MTPRTSHSFGRWLGAILCLLAGAAACTPEPESEPERSAPVLAPVALDAIALIEARLADARATALPSSTPPIPPAELVRRMEGLMGFATGSGGRARDAGVTDLVDSPAEASAWLRARALDEDAREAERYLCLEVLERRGGQDDAEALMAIAERARPAGLRAGAYWRLGRMGEDAVLARLTLRLKYETDWEAVLWLGWALCQHGIYSGLDGVLAVANSAPDRDLAERATAEAQALADEIGAGDAYQLANGWWRGELPAGAVPRVRSLEYQLELWRWIARFDEFQLRGVDDARFLLARLDGVAADVLGAALFDASPYVRLGAVQCLERMGPRAHSAGPLLLEHLDDPELGPWVASALGRIQYPPAKEALEQRLQPGTAPALEVAAARALGHLGLAEAVPALLAALKNVDAGQRPELHQAIAESLVWCGAPAFALEALVAALTDPRLEPSTSSAALRHHLARQAAASVPGAQDVLTEFDALNAQRPPAAAPGSAAPTRGGAAPREIEAARAALLRNYFDSANPLDSAPVTK